jgi:hypothetical protein
VVGLIQSTKVGRDGEMDGDRKGMDGCVVVWA